MKFSSKLTAVVATAAIFCPISAYANPVSTGSTAAAVSIKFQDCKCGPTSGNFSINPGGNANGGGTGVQELSAAVATGETKATAKSASNKSGTTANAYGYSAPVNFSYRTYSDVSNRTYSSEYTQNSEYKEQAAIEFAAKQKNSESTSASETEKVSLLKKGYYDSKGNYIKYNSSETETSKSSSSSDGSLSLKANGQASASQSSASTKYSASNSNENGTSYEYTGSSAGLSFIPAIVK
jgi:hypothetical protein